MLLDAQFTADPFQTPCPPTQRKRMKESQKKTKDEVCAQQMENMSKRLLSVVGYAVLILYTIFLPRLQPSMSIRSEMWLA